MPSEYEKGLAELRTALGASEELKELRARLVVVDAVGAQHARRLAGTLSAFLDGEDPRRFWYFPKLNGRLLAKVLLGTLFRISSRDPDPAGRAKAARLLASLQTL